MPRVLLVAHEYPPIRSAGTERIINFARYLPEYDYEPLVLATARYGGLPDDAARRVYRAPDVVDVLFGALRRRRAAGLAQADAFRVATVANESLLGRLRDRIMIPDTKIGWLPPAARLGARIAAEGRPDVIFSSSPPETAHLIALRVAAVSGLPWVADLRDGWLFEPPNPGARRGRVRLAIERRLERAMALHAAGIVTSTLPLAADLAARYPAAAGRVRTIFNGYDPAEFAELARRREPDGRFLIVHTGSLAASRQGTTAEAFFAGLVRFRAARPDAALEVRLIGDAGEAQQRAAAERHGLADIVRFIPRADRREAHRHQLDADALLLITAPGQRSVATLKLFDYIGAGVPILALAEGNAACEIVRSYGVGVTAAPDDPEAVAGALAEMVDRHAQGAAWPGFAEAQAAFSRRTEAGQLAALFDDLLCRGSRHEPA